MAARHRPRIVVFGAGGQAKVTADVIRKQDVYETAAFLVDDRTPAPAETLHGIPVVHSEDWSPHRMGEATGFVVAVGDNALRRAKAERLIALGLDPLTVAHPFTSIGEGCRLGRGTVICASVTLDPEVTLGDGCIINGGVAIGHESTIEDYAHVSAAALVGANCRVGREAFVGMGAIVVSGIRIGRGAFVGAGSIVHRDLPDGARAMGRPVRVAGRA